jgi:hypothetical protein
MTPRSQSVTYTMLKFLFKDIKTFQSKLTDFIEKIAIRNNQPYMRFS